MNNNRVFKTQFIPTHLTNIPLNPHYLSGFIEGDGLLIVELTGLIKYRINISIEQHKNSLFLLESLKSILNIESSLVLSKNTEVLKLAKSGDKYFKTFLIPFFIKYPLHGYKLIQLYKILLILNLKDYSNITEIKVFGKIIALKILL